MKCSKDLIKKIAIISITVIAVIITIICAIYFSNKASAKTQTFLPVENYTNNKTENEENIERLVAILSPTNETGENTTSEIDNNKINTNSNDTTSGTTQNTSNYYIKVNYGANVVTVYTKDNDGNYTVPYKAMICSTGTSTPTSGVYPIKLKWKWLALFGDVYGYYTTQIVGNILFHSVPYLEKGNPASLEYWEYDKLGTSASMGCIRLKVEDAMWIYYNCPSGTPVEFYSSSNPGPLGKPSALKISGYASPYRDWDPADPDNSNPWITNPPTNNEPVNTVDPENKVETETSNNTFNNIINNNTIENSTNVNNPVDNSVNNSTINDVILNNTVSDNNNTIENDTISNNNIEVNNILENDNRTS